MEKNVNIETGDINAVGANVVLGENNSAINQLTQSGHPELAQVLKTMTDAVLASNELPTDKKEEQVKLISQICKEASEPKPNKTMLKILVDGLMATLKAVPDLANAVSGVSQIMGLLHLHP